MKLLPESPVEFLESLSRPPETVYVTEVTGTFGTAVMAGTSKGLLSLRVDIPLSHFTENIKSNWGSDVKYDNSHFDSVRESVRGYLDGNSAPLKAIVQPVMLTPFTVNVHNYLSRIPFGKTGTYGEIAALMGKPGAARAVGGACGRNSVLIVVPCHRVVAANGYGGFGVGLNLKKRLLEFENIML